VDEEKKQVWNSGTILAAILDEKDALPPAVTSVLLPELAGFPTHRLNRTNTLILTLLNRTNMLILSVYHFRAV
jgi:hypothetical protein